MNYTAWGWPVSQACLNCKTHYLSRFISSFPFDFFFTHTWQIPNVSPKTVQSRIVRLVIFHSYADCRDTLKGQKNAAVTIKVLMDQCMSKTGSVFMGTFTWNDRSTQVQTCMQARTPIALVEASSSHGDGRCKGDAVAPSYAQALHNTIGKTSSLVCLSL